MKIVNSCSYIQKIAHILRNLLPSSQEFATGTYSAPGESSPRPHSLFPLMSILILSYAYLPSIFITLRFISTYYMIFYPLISTCHTHLMLRFISGVVVLTTGLRAGRPGFSFRLGQGIFSHIQSVQTGSGAHPDSHKMGAGLFPQG
jgi:hypothetical protein